MVPPTMSPMEENLCFDDSLDSSAPVVPTPVVDEGKQTGSFPLNPQIVPLLHHEYIVRFESTEQH